MGRVSRKHLVLAQLCWVASFACTGSNLRSEPTSSKSAANPPRPVANESPKPQESTVKPTIVLYFEGSRGLSPRLEAAIWNDGYVLRSGNNTAGEPAHMIAMRVNPMDVSTAFDEIAKSGILNFDSRVWSPPDAPNMGMIVRTHQRTVTQLWDERIAPNYGHNTDPSHEYKTFIAAWAQAKVAIAAAQTHARNGQHVETKDPEALRGFDIENPLMTPWIRD